MRKGAMWVDAARCTGCGRCVEVCPTGAITITAGKASIAEDLCTGCGACADVCPEGAIGPVVQGELVEAPAQPLDVGRRANPLPAITAGAVVATGAGLLVRALGSVVQTVGRWLTAPSGESRTTAAGGFPATGARGGAGRGRRARRRRRGA